MMKDEANSHALMNIKKMFHDALGYVRQNANMHSNVVSLPPPDPYWQHARYLLIQLWGIHDAYNFAAIATIQEMSAHRHLRGPRPGSPAHQQPLTMKREG